MKPSPNHGTPRLPNDDEDESSIIVNNTSVHSCIQSLQTSHISIFNSYIPPVFHFSIERSPTTPPLLSTMPFTHHHVLPRSPTRHMKQELSAQAPQHPRKLKSTVMLPRVMRTWASRWTTGAVGIICSSGREVRAADVSRCSHTPSPSNVNPQTCKRR